MPRSRSPGANSISITRTLSFQVEFFINIRAALAGPVHVQLRSVRESIPGRELMKTVYSISYCYRIMLLNNLIVFQLRYFNTHRYKDTTLLTIKYKKIHKKYQKAKRNKRI